VQFHVLSFEGPDAYARIGGLASRVEGLTECLVALGFETHHWFVGDPSLPGHQTRQQLHLHRWCQWISRYRPGGVYDGEEEKLEDFSRSAPPFLLRDVLGPHVQHGGRAVVLAEEWHTVPAVLELDRLLRERGARDRVEILWNANNTYGFERIPWARLREASRITTVSRYMHQQMLSEGVDALVVPNGLPRDAFDAPAPAAVRILRSRFRDRTVLTKLARWHPDKAWVTAFRTVAEMKERGWRPLLIARGGREPYGQEMRAFAERLGLSWTDRVLRDSSPEGLRGALQDLHEIDVVSLLSHLSPSPRRVLLRFADAVLANSVHEPFGLVGLETMAVGGIACTGCSGEDYVLPGQNALMVETDDPAEFLELYGWLRSHPKEERSLRRTARWTARRFAWPEVLDRLFLPHLMANGSGIALHPTWIPFPGALARAG